MQSGGPGLRIESLMTRKVGLQIGFALTESSQGVQFAVASGFRNVTVTPAPEPESWAMLLAGLGLMGTIARRRSVR